MSEYTIVLLKHPDDGRLLDFLNAGSVYLDGGFYSTAIVTGIDAKRQPSPQAIVALLQAKVAAAYLTIEQREFERKAEGK